MSQKISAELTRRRFISRSTLALATCSSALLAGTAMAAPLIQRNISGFRAQNWTQHFTTLKHGAILCDTVSRVLHFWSEDQTDYRLYPTSVPKSEEFTRRGRTEIVRKVIGPTWRPTPSMRRRDPALPAFVPAGPDNPLGTHALYLSWQYYRIHGTQDPRKIGRQSSSGCIGLYNENIAELFALTKVGTQVLLI